MTRRKKTPRSSRQHPGQRAKSKGQSVAVSGEPPTIDQDGARAFIQESIKRASISDTPALEDKIGFQHYVDAVAAFLVDERTLAPLTLSIEGEWGAGKSSFLAQLEQALRHRYATRTVKFNAWRHDKDEALWASFAIEFARQIAPQGYMARLLKRLSIARRTFKWREGLPDLIRLVAGVPLAAIVVGLFFQCVLNLIQPPEWLQWFTDASLPLRAAVLTLAGALSASPLLKMLLDFVGNPLRLDLSKHLRAPDYQGRRPFLEQFHEDFRTVLDVYVGPEIAKVFVFIDDLDRCEVPKAAELLQALHLMIPTDTKLIFILGMDRNIVAAGIAQRQAEILPLLNAATVEEGHVEPPMPQSALAFGHAFLDRFIQIPFRIPRMDGASLQVFCESLMLDPALLAERKRDDAQYYVADVDWSLFEFGRPQSRTVLTVEPADADSPGMRNIVALVAPAVGFNPRKLKQFINAFRLSAYIHGRIGSFDVVPGCPDSSRLDLVRLAKIVALELWWPRMLGKAEQDQEYLRNLEIKLRASQALNSQATASAGGSLKAEEPSMQILSIGLHDGHDLGGIDFSRLRRVAPLARRTGFMTDWRMRGTASWRPTSRSLPKRILQWAARSQESEVKVNLKGLYTSQMAWFSEKDCFESDLCKIGFKPLQRKDGSVIPIPDSRWVAGTQFIYSVEVRGTEFYGYALGIRGSVVDVEYEIRSDGDWKGRPRRVAPAAVDSPKYRTLYASHAGVNVNLKYPATFTEAPVLRRDGLALGLALSSEAFSAIPGQAPGTEDAAVSVSSSQSDSAVFECVFVASDSSAHLRVCIFDGIEWKRMNAEGDGWAAAKGKTVLTRLRRSDLLWSSGYASGWAFTHAVMLKGDVVVDIELRCEVQAKTGYAPVMRRIMDSVNATHAGRWGQKIFSRLA